MEQVYEKIWQIPVPLPNNPLKAVNCYVVKDKNRSLIIDTGFNTPESKAVLFGGLEELGIDMTTTDVFVTHLHADHSGLSSSLKNDTNHVYISTTDGTFLDLSAPLNWLNIMLSKQNLMGVPVEKRLTVEQHPGYKHKIDKKIDFTLIEPGLIINIADYQFEVLDLHGHSPGQLGLWEPNHAILFSGDHILDKITPNIGFWDLQKDYLGAFINNLKKIKDLPLKTVFPAHRQIINNPNARIDQIIAHHEKRLNEILKVLQKGQQIMYDIAASIPWDFSGGQFLDFPPLQKWFAVSEVFAHMEHLEYQGKVSKEVRPEDGALLYNIA